MLSVMELAVYFDGETARHFTTNCKIGMAGLMSIPVPMAFYSFGGWKQSLFGDYATWSRRYKFTLD